MGRMTELLDTELEYVASRRGVHCARVVVPRAWRIPQEQRKVQQLRRQVSAAITANAHSGQFTSFLGLAHTVCAYAAAHGHFVRERLDYLHTIARRDEASPKPRDRRFAFPISLAIPIEIYRETLSFPLSSFHSSKEIKRSRVIYTHDKSIKF